MDRYCQLTSDTHPFQGTPYFTMKLANEIGRVEDINFLKTKLSSRYDSPNLNSFQKA
jgi:hypothetical protein